ncbi:unnamed protein product [Mycena citricolor]|uniref:Uncharacterized protein n=1 Tax=Mycena citricolor TaxID=2018698 RepID=A0AAD2GTP0_9AGAR|nr:unnamed protein product [Mycena citricolor]
MRTASLSGWAYDASMVKKAVYLMLLSVEVMKISRLPDKTSGRL